MFDDPGDLDRNGIPDSIQLDPVVVPEEPAPFSLFAPVPGLPGIDSPIEATADAQVETPTPAEPTPPPSDADEAAQMRYQQQLQEYNRTMDMLTNVQQMMHETQKAIVQNFRS